MGKITDTGKQYVPAGLTAKQYQAIREADFKKKQAKYEKNAKKAGVFQDFTEWYKKRGTDLDQPWIKKATKGHSMAKTKYDWSGLTDKKLWVKAENTATKK